MNIKIGGQAVFEGVMMRSDNFICTSVRTDKGIVSKSRRFNSLTERFKVLGFPFIRGVFMLFELMIQGFKEISWASDQALEEDNKLSFFEILLMIFLSLVIGLGFFKLLPWFLSNVFLKGNVYVNFLDAFFKILFLVLYLLFISFVPDIKRIFMYHGAEHKVVGCFESKKVLNVKNSKKFSRIHPRCGTTFIFLVFLISLFFYMLIPLNFGFWSNFGIRILLLPLIAGVSYELIRLEGKYYSRSKIVRFLAWPGLQFQRLTTKEPDDLQLEVAIHALNCCLINEKKIRKS